MGTNNKLNILIVTPFALWMYIICISNIIMQELSGAPYIAGIITYVSAFIIFMLLLAAFTEYQKNGGQREVFKMDMFLPDRWYCCIYSCRVYCFTCIERNWNGMKRQNTRRKCSHIRWKDVCLGLSIYKMNVMVNNKNLSKYGEYHGKRTNAY